MFFGFVQAWAGVFYLLNKLFFLGTETTHDEVKKQRRKVKSWWFYIIGLFGWLIILGHKNDWIAFGAEVAGLPSMVNGLVNAYRGRKKNSNWLKVTAAVIALAGIVYSYVELGGLTSQTQVMEFGIVVGFLIGTFLVGEESRRWGYVCLLIMNASCALLMQEQGFVWLYRQQVASFVIVFLALLFTFRKQKSS